MALFFSHIFFYLFARQIKFVLVIFTFLYFFTILLLINFDAIGRFSALLEISRNQDVGGSKMGV